MNRGQGWKTPRGQGSRIGKNNNIFAIVPIPMPTTSTPTTSLCVELVNLSGNIKKYLS